MIQSYVEAYKKFNIQEVAKKLHGNLDNGINAAIECCDRHISGKKIALDWEGVDGKRSQHTFQELKDRSSQFSNYLKSQGIKKGDVVATLLPRTPELLVMILGIWRIGAVYQPLFTAFGPKAIEQRLETSHAKMVITNIAHLEKLSGLSVKPIIVDVRIDLSSFSNKFETVLLKGTDLFVMLSTSGTTGLPKAVPISLFALLAFREYMVNAIDLRPEDKFWNLADPGWAYGLYYMIVGPSMLGQTIYMFEGAFTPESTYRIIKDRGITSLAGSPTAFRLLIAAGEEKAHEIKGQLRVVSSAGEPLNPEVIRWMHEHLNVDIYDHYGQTELGMVVNNHHGLAHKVKPGSMGYAMPGYEVAVLDEHGNKVGANTPGVLAIDIANSPLLWFRGYYQNETPAISGGFYRTGDTVEQTEDGMLSFVGRADDVITSSGYKIGPFDVESALLEHPSVVEAAVVGKPDPERTEIVKAFVVLKKGFPRSEVMKAELALHVKKNLSAHAYPREIEFIDELPKTPSGKIQRFLLRNKN